MFSLCVALSFLQQVLATLRVLGLQDYLPNSVCLLVFVLGFSHKNFCLEICPNPKACLILPPQSLGISVLYLTVTFKPLFYIFCLYSVHFTWEDKSSPWLLCLGEKQIYTDLFFECQTNFEFLQIPAIFIHTI